MTIERMRRSACVGLASLGIAVTFGVAEAAAAAQAGRGVSPDEAVAMGAASPTELQRLFDAYVLVQAQDALQLTDTQYPQFLARLRALQDVRRRTQVDRTRIIVELRQLADQGRTDVSARERIADRLKALREVEGRGHADAQQALEKLDEVLEPVQQARLRVLEEQMERRKLELLVRARQTARARRGR